MLRHFRSIACKRLSEPPDGLPTGYGLYREHPRSERTQTLFGRRSYPDGLGKGDLVGDVPWARSALELESGSHRANGVSNLTALWGVAEAIRSLIQQLHSHWGVGSRRSFTWPLYHRPRSRPNRHSQGSQTSHRPRFLLRRRTSIFLRRSPTRRRAHNRPSQPVQAIEPRC